MLHPPLLSSASLITVKNLWDLGVYKININSVCGCGRRRVILLVRVNPRINLIFAGKLLGRLSDFGVHQQKEEEEDGGKCEAVICDFSPISRSLKRNPGSH